ncbi:MAG: hypothetical protein K2X82_08550 [Gemmataceae bacterium]|nr:hypothetical protein [Gemmataceae bacterium]
MEPSELRDLDAARRYVVEGLWLQRAARPTPATVRPALEWAMEVVAAGHPLPPVGFVADVGYVALGADAEHRAKDPVPVPGWPPAVGRMYEDYLLGRLYADWAFERAGDALRKYHGRDRIKGVAYLVDRVRERAGLPGVSLPPAAVRRLLTANPEEVLSSAWDGLLRDGPSARLVEMYRAMGEAGRRLSEVLVKEDVEALEDGSALGDLGQYVALRQVRRTAARLAGLLPARAVRPLVGRREVPTRILDEDQYPVGGYTSIATKGSVESLLHSQLAYIEDDPAEAPDLFDVKFARDELFYYSRDENQFLRRRRAFVFALFPDLLAARFKDPELPAQRIVMVLSAVLTLVGKLSDWLSTDALRFEVLFVRDGERSPLADEQRLMELLLRVPVERGDGLVTTVADRAEAAAHLGRLARQAQVHCLAAGAGPTRLAVENAVVTELVVDGPRPKLGDGDRPAEDLPADDPFDAWREAVLRVLQLWV